MRFYRVSLDDIGESVSARDAAAMVAHLPSEAATRRARGDGWSELERLVAEVAANVAVVWWQRTDHSRSGNGEPPRVLSPRERREAAEEAATYTHEYMDEVADMLGIPKDRR